MNITDQLDPASTAVCAASHYICGDPFIFTCLLQWHQGGGFDEVLLEEGAVVRGEDSEVREDEGLDKHVGVAVLTDIIQQLSPRLVHQRLILHDLREAALQRTWGCQSNKAGMIKNKVSIIKQQSGYQLSNIQCIQGNICPHFISVLFACIVTEKYW